MKGARTGYWMARILLAEDDVSMRRFLSVALERAGHDVYAVGDGTEALAAIGGRPYDLLVTDIVMPGLDGIELARHAAVEAPGLRIMFITGFAAVAMHQGEGVVDAQVLSKPFHLRELVEQVDRFLSA